MSTIRIDDESIPIAETIVGLTVAGIQAGQTVRVPPLLLKGNKGDMGDPMTFSDLTPQQIEVLQQPAADMIAQGEQVIQDAITATENAQFQADRFTNIAVLASKAVADITDYNKVVI